MGSFSINTLTTCRSTTILIDAGELEHTKLKLEECLSDINVVMLHNNQQLNDDKTTILFSLSC